VPGKTYLDLTFLWMPMLHWLRLSQRYPSFESFLESMTSGKEKKAKSLSRALAQTLSNSKLVESHGSTMATVSIP
jgi:3-methyladenine DNA glycosylase Tag